ncbi:MAG: UTP--glucose-1-phosphate uridylyltransferase [Atopobiaceae bacterium]|nr:UTP--glucose-1-phosphate uridylyltransferase [Atopobiaceae bacterium]
MKAVIPAAGMGTRFLPATKCSPKELLPVLDKPVIQYVVEEALEPEGVDEAVIIVSKEKPQIEHYFSPAPELEDFLQSKGKDELAKRVQEAGALPVSFANQDEPLGLGHAVLCAADAIDNEPFFVLLGDYFVPSRQMCIDMLEVSRAHNNASVIAVAPAPEDQVSRYGIVGGSCVGCLEGHDASGEQPGAIWKVDTMVEKPKLEDAPSHLYIVGRYLLSPRVMELLKTQTPGAGGEIQLTDAMLRLLDEEEMYALVVDPKQGCDTGTPAAWAATNARMALEHPDTKLAFYEELGDVEL